MNRPGINAMSRAAAFAVLLVGTACSFGPSPRVQYLEDAAAHAILPLYRRLAASTGELRARVDAFCGGPARVPYEEARDAWRQAMADWKRVEVVRFGPVTVDNQGWKLQFWPDRNNLVGNKIAELLDSGDALTPERLEQASVVVQGLSAAEFLLFDDDGGTFGRYEAARHDDAARRCRLLERIAAHTEGVAAGLERVWLPAAGNYAEQLTTPGPDNAEFADENAAVGAVVDGILATLEVTKDDRLAEPLGLDNDLGIPKPYSVEAWRSGHSLPLIAAALDGARRLYYAGDDPDAGFGVDDLLREADADALADTIDAQFDAVAEAMPEGLVLFDAVGEEAAAAELKALHETLTALTQSVRNDVPPVLGITLGFNRNDGD